MHIREARIEDIDYIHAINKSALGYTHDLSLAKKNLKTILNKPGDKIFVMDDNGIVVGYIHAIDYVITYDKPLKLITSLAVNPKMQGQGVGKKLLQKIEEIAMIEGFEGVRLSSGETRVEAHQFYEHCQYKVKKMHKTFVKYYK